MRKPSVNRTNVNQLSNQADDAPAREMVSTTQTRRYTQTATSTRPVSISRHQQKSISIDAYGVRCLVPVSVG